MRPYSFLILFFILSLHGYGQLADSIGNALGIIDLSFSPAAMDSMAGQVEDQRGYFREIRETALPNDLPYSLVFLPPLNGAAIPEKQEVIHWELPATTEPFRDIESLAFYPVHQLASLLRTGKVTSEQLTRMFLERLRKYGDTLECVITLTDSLALAQARRADAEMARGIYRGPLHGIPYGAKDLLSVKGYPTTWGAMPYRDQQINENATVIRKLEDAGAVLVAKLTLGALAYGDVWYGGMTRNPWDLSEGSSGSSAGSASATAAGLVPFAIGTETWGSIVSPSSRCGVTGLRPTFGRVSRHGAMALSWSMDKIGPLCRDAADCALVFDAIRGTDGFDPSLKDLPFNYDYRHKASKLRVGVLTGQFTPEDTNYKNDSATLELLRSQGFQMVTKTLPADLPAEALSIILFAEAAAAFDELTRSGLDSLMVRQMQSAWPNTFRASRLIPAVEYIQANRLRYALTVAFNEMMQDIDVLIAPSFTTQLLVTNLTGHPCVVLPNGSYAGKDPGTITLIGNHFDEARILAFARFLQEITSYHTEHPPLFGVK